MMNWLKAAHTPPLAVKRQPLEITILRKTANFFPSVMPSSVKRTRSSPASCRLATTTKYLHTQSSLASCRLAAITRQGLHGRILSLKLRHGTREACHLVHRPHQTHPATCWVAPTRGSGDAKPLTPCPQYILPAPGTGRGTQEGSRGCQAPGPNHLISARLPLENRTKPSIATGSPVFISRSGQRYAAASPTTFERLHHHVLHLWCTWVEFGCRVSKSTGVPALTNPMQQEV